MTNGAREKPDFVLNREPWRHAKILVAGANFGCGSSREHAPWALADFGIRCVIAENFADIFYNNCSKNGILAAITPAADVAALLDDAQAGRELSVDLAAQTIIGSSRTATFEIDAHRKHCLLNGLDDIGLTLKKESAIAAYEEQNRREKPWLWNAMESCHPERSEGSFRQFADGDPSLRSG